MTEDLEQKLTLAKARAARFKSACKQAESLLEEKSRELYAVNCDLERAHQDLEFDIQQATYELSVSNKRLQKALNERSTFIGQMSHEVRTPLNAIAGLSEILLGTDLDSTQLDYIDTINSAARSLTVLINDMLDITKIEAGKVKMLPVEIDSMRLHRNVVSMFKLDAKAKGLSLHLDIDKSMPDILLLDKGRYKQILSNLISNAIRNTEQGDIFVTSFFTEGTTSKDLGILTVKVQDTGVGIAEDQLSRIFNAYEQLGTPNKGVGLGLAICSQLTKLMEGELSCQSEIGVGSTFKLSIPVESYNRKDAEKTKKLNSVASPQKKLKILIAEDNPTNQKVITAQLAQLGQVADITNNGAEAISKLKDQSYDLVLLDIIMPIMDGEETLKAIRNASARIASHYCVALTASSYEDQRDRLINLGFDEFLSKPLGMSELSDTLMTVSMSLQQEISALSKVAANVKAAAELTSEFDLIHLKTQFADAAEMVFMEIAPTFLEHTANDFKLLESAIEQDRTDKIQSLSHSIKGAALSLGLNDLASILEKIEHKPDDVSVHDVFSKAEEHWSTAESSVEVLLERLKREMANA